MSFSRSSGRRSLSLPFAPAQFAHPQLKSSSTTVSTSPWPLARQACTWDTHQHRRAKLSDWCRAGNAPADFLVGVSCHSLEGAQEAESAGTSYTYFGPIYETPSKIPFGKPHGVEELAQVASAVTIPVIAIGGVNESNAAECIRAGAAGIAAIRMIQDAADTTALKNAIDAIHGWR